MAGASITLDIDDREVLDALNALARRGSDLRPALQEIGEQLVQSTKDRFAEQKAPDGTRWEELSPKYQARKKKNQDLILVLNGYLVDSIRYQANAEELRVGSDRKYAAAHQFGFDGEVAVPEHNRLITQAFGRKLKFPVYQTVGAFSRHMDIPARPFLGISDDDRAMVLQVLQEYLLAG